MTDATMNGAVEIRNPCVDLLEQLLAQAKAGHVDTLGVIFINKTGSTSRAVAGGRLGDLYTGCGMLQFELMNRFMAPQQQSRILRPMI